MRVHQALSGAGPHDAVTNQALAYRERFTRWGWDGTDAAATMEPELRRRLTPLRRLRPAPGDVVVVHLSAYAPRFRDVLALPGRKLLVSHNITPAEWLWRWSPSTAVFCAVGREQVPEFVAACDVCAGVSAFNAAELAAAGARETTVVPILFDPASLPPVPRRDDGGPPSEVLFVGRVAPHKRQDALIRAVALARRVTGLDVRLRLVGAPMTEAYGRALAGLGAALLPGAFTLERDLSRDDLWDRYARADAFVSLSEHEGFCVPLLEAFHAGLPVVARAAAAVPETVGDAGVLLAPEDGLPVVAEALAAVLTDGALRTTLVERGRARLGHFALGRAEAALRTAVERTAAAGRG